MTEGNTQEFIFSEFPFPEIETTHVEVVAESEEEIVYFDNIDLPLYMQDNEEYVDRIIRLLPYDWVIRFGAHDHLDTLDVEDYISMLYFRLSKQTIRAIMETSIMASRPDDEEYEGSTPIAVLLALDRKRADFIRLVNKEIYRSSGRFIPSRLHALLDKVKFDGKMYELICSDKCIDSIRILSTFYNEPAKEIQHAWLKYRNEKRNRSAQLIQQKVIKWLYRPGGPIMKRAESHFYNCV
jgi:hypothetical protein